MSFWIILPIGGIAYVLSGARRFGLLAAALAVGGALALATTAGPVAGSSLAVLVAPGSVGAGALFVSGLKAGLLTFGGAYTAIPFMRDDALGQGWLSEGQFLDSLALSGVIPAPLIIFTTFVGFIAGGLGGALAITAGVFLPAFGFALLFYDRLEQVIEDERLHDFLSGVAAAVVGLIAVTALELGLGLARTVPSLAVAGLIFVAALATLYGWKSRLNIVAVIGGAGMLGGWLMPIAA